MVLCEKVKERTEQYHNTMKHVAPEERGGSKGQTPWIATTSRLPDCPDSRQWRRNTRPSQPATTANGSEAPKGGWTAATRPKHALQPPFSSLSSFLSLSHRPGLVL